MNAKANVEMIDRHVATGTEPEVFTDIYQSKTHITVWQREPCSALAEAAKNTLQNKPDLNLKMIVSAEEAYTSMYDALGDTPNKDALCTDIAELVDMFSCLFELRRVGLRLTVLNRAMCPKFHVDRIPCRLVTTYQGAGTQWLPHSFVDRSKLGHNSNGLADSESGLYHGEHKIQQLNSEDVALLKGELWDGNEGAGLVHRSPAAEQPRLLLTLDFSD